MNRSPQHNRRRLLQLACAGAAAWCLPHSALSQLRSGTNPFTLGVASGSPTHDSLVLWTRLHVPGFFDGLGSAPVAVRWEMADDEQFSRIVQSGVATAGPELGHSVHVEVTGLASDRWFFYRFMAGDAVSPVGRDCTFPLPDALAARRRLGYASCQKWEDGYCSAWRHMRQDNQDVRIVVGDDTE